jgi:hypothetical protein
LATASGRVTRSPQVSNVRQGSTQVSTHTRPLVTPSLAAHAPREVLRAGLRRGQGADRSAERGRLGQRGCRRPLADMLDVGTDLLRQHLVAPAVLVPTGRVRDRAQCAANNQPIEPRQNSRELVLVVGDTRLHGVSARSLFGVCRVWTAPHPTRGETPPFRSRLRRAVARWLHVDRLYPALLRGGLLRPVRVDTRSVQPVGHDAGELARLDRFADLPVAPGSQRLCSSPFMAEAVSAMITAWRWTGSALSRRASSNPSMAGI